jgi:hypothetical protein
VCSQRAVQAVRQNRDAIPPAFSVSYDDRPAIEVQILDAKPQAFEQPKPGAVQEARHHPADPGQLRQDGSDLLSREHHRQARRAACSREVAEFGGLLLEHFAVEEEQRIQRLVLRRSRHAAVHCQVGQELLDLP